MAKLSVIPGTVSQKATRVISNHGGIITKLASFQCDHQHEHLQLQGGLPKEAQVYPPKLVNAILQGLLRPSDLGSISLMANAVEDDDEDEEEEDPVAGPSRFHWHSSPTDSKTSNHPSTGSSDSSTKKKCFIGCTPTWGMLRRHKCSSCSKPPVPKKVF